MRSSAIFTGWPFGGWVRSGGGCRLLRFAKLAKPFRLARTLVGFGSDNLSCRLVRHRRLILRGQFFGFENSLFGFGHDVLLCGKAGLAISGCGQPF